LLYNGANSDSQDGNPGLSDVAMTRRRAMIERWSVRVVVAGVALLVVIAGSQPAWAQDCTAGAAFSGPIIITSGGTYTGN
jgi:hypothetical protein